MERFGDTKIMPKWSEPCRILSFRNKEKTALLVQRIWHTKLQRKINIKDVIRLPRKFGPDTIIAAKKELIADLHKHYIDPENNGTDPTPAELISENINLSELFTDNLNNTDVKLTELPKSVKHKRPLEDI